MTKRKGAFVHNFRVRWDARRERFVALGHKGEFFGADRDLQRIVETAIQQADAASRAGCEVVVLVENRDGVFRRLYRTQPDKTECHRHSQRPEAGGAGEMNGG